MGDRLLPPSRTKVGLIATLLALPVIAVAQQPATKTPVTKPATATSTWIAPRTAGGQPDLQGTWTNNAATPLERPKALEGREFLTDAEVEELRRRADRLFKKDGASDFAAGDTVFLLALENRDVYKNPGTTGGAVEMPDRTFDNRTSLVVDPKDGHIPPLTPEARQRQAAAAAANRRLPDGPEALVNQTRCLTYGTPRLGGRFGSGDTSYYQIVQGPGYVVIALEMIHEVRIIPLDGGHWEGETLVVDTTNFSSQINFMGASDHLHMVERLTRTAPDTINYAITIDDPTTWTKPWTAVLHLKESHEALFETACHEGNLHVMEGVLFGARTVEKDAENAAQQKK